MTTNGHYSHRFNDRTPAQSPPGISPSAPSDGGEGKGRGGPCSCAAPLSSIANLKSKIENSRRPVLGRSNLSRTESQGQFTRLLAYRCCRARRAESLSSDLSTEALLAKVEALLAEEGGDSWPLRKSEKCDGISHISHFEILQKCPISNISHQILPQVQDWREPIGKRHRLATGMSIVVLACLSGVGFISSTQFEAKIARRGHPH